MRPRVHNVVSYAVTLLVFWTMLYVRARTQPLTATAELGAALWTAHFVRRTLESAFVHRYSKPQVAASDYLSEYLYYWGFAAWIAWSLTSPSAFAARPGLQALGLALFVVAEASNARAHITLRDLRAPGGSERGIPSGSMFELVSCPHYFWEISSWVGFNLVTGTWAGTLFMLLGAGILAAWARTRHQAYRSEFDGQAGRRRYPPTRRALIPFLF